MRRKRIKSAFDAGEVMPLVLEIYERQVERQLAELSIDDEPDEFERRVGAMRDWSEFCGRESSAEIRASVRHELFGRDVDPVIARGDDLPGSSCKACGGSGLLYTEACNPNYHNANKQTGSGFVVCECGAGKKRNEAIREHGKPKSSGRTRKREDF